MASRHRNIEYVAVPLGAPLDTAMRPVVVAKAAAPAFVGVQEQTATPAPAASGGGPIPFNEDDDGESGADTPTPRPTPTSRRAQRPGKSRDRDRDRLRASTRPLRDVAANAKRARNGRARQLEMEDEDQEDQDDIDADARDDARYDDSGDAVGDDADADDEPFYASGSAPRVDAPPRTFTERQVDLYGPAWLTREVVAQLELFRAPLYAFARLVAGKTNTTAKALMQPLDEGLARYVEARGATLDSFLDELSKAAAESPANGAAATAIEPSAVVKTEDGAPAGAQAQAQAPAPGAPPNLAKALASRIVTSSQSREERQQGTLALALWRAGALTSEIVDAARLVSDRFRERTRATFAWLQMPQHLGQVLYNEVLQAAVEGAYADVTDQAERTEFALADLVETASPLRDRFASLVAAHIKIARADMQTRYMRAGARQIFVKERASLVRYFRGLPRPFLLGAGPMGVGLSAPAPLGRGVWASNTAALGAPLLGTRGEIAGFESLYRR